MIPRTCAFMVTSMLVLGMSRPSRADADDPAYIGEGLKMALGIAVIDAGFSVYDAAAWRHPSATVGGFGIGVGAAQVIGCGVLAYESEVWQFGVVGLWPAAMTVHGARSTQEHVPPSTALAPAVAGVGELLWVVLSGRRRSSAVAVHPRVGRDQSGIAIAWRF